LSKILVVLPILSPEDVAAAKERLNRGQTVSYDIQYSLVDTIEHLYLQHQADAEVISRLDGLHKLDHGLADQWEKRNLELRQLIRDLWRLPIGIRQPDMARRVREALDC
jgi:hypothetical protein